MTVFEVCKLVAIFSGAVIFALIYCSVALFWKRRSQAVTARHCIVLAFIFVLWEFAWRVSRNTAIAHEFDGILGGAYHFDQNGNLETAKRVIPHAEKTRYFLQIAQRLELYRERRVENLTPNTYGEESELLQSILLGVEEKASCKASPCENSAEDSNCVRLRTLKGFGIG